MVFQIVAACPVQMKIFYLIFASSLGGNILDKKRILAIERNVNVGVSQGLLQVVLDDVPADGRFIQIDHQRCLNFASCSYLGLELDKRIKESVISAVKRYGSQFSASRIYLSVHLYEEVEERIQKICQRPVIVTPNTTLGHQSAIPVLIGDEDAVIIDQQVHNSVTAACRALSARRIRMDLVSHNHVDRLDRRIQRLKSNYKRVWYFMDGLYSMHGDLAPLEDLALLLDRYEQLHIYADDAHGVSWQGQNGQGAVLARFSQHPNVTVALSLNKSFASSGGAIAFADESAKRNVRNLGETLTFSGPIQPPMLGAICASADIHLSEELAYHQARLRQRIQLFNDISFEKRLNLKNKEISPIRFIQIGSREDTVWLVRKLLDEGFFTCASGFPSVGRNKAGVRITINNHLKEEDIRSLLDTMSHLIQERGEDFQHLRTAERRASA